MSGIAAILMKYLIGLVGGITIVVVIHEIGHLVTAKLNGIDVEVFSFGLGPKLIATNHKGTEYRLSLLPFGGYCRLKGSDDLSQALIHKQKQFTHTEEGSLFFQLIRHEESSPISVGRLLIFSLLPSCMPF